MAAKKSRLLWGIVAALGCWTSASAAPMSIGVPMDGEFGPLDSRAGDCGVSPAEFRAAAVVVVSEDGTPDPEAPDALTLDLGQYKCLFPLDSVSEDEPDPVDTFFNVTELEGAENLTQAMFVPDPASMVYTPQAAVGLPGAEVHTRDLQVGGSQSFNTPLGTYTVNSDGRDVHVPGIDVYAPSVSVPSLSADGLQALAAQTVEGLWPLPGPDAPSAVNGELILRVYLPMRNDFLFPDGGCNSSSTAKAVQALKDSFGPRSLKVKTYCYMDNQASTRWDTCNGDNDDCTFYIQELMDRFIAHINSKRSSFVDGSNELVTTYVRRASSNGVGERFGAFSMVAESAQNKPDSPQGAILLHELGHNFGARHLPNETPKKYMCNNGGGTDYKSIMNYCYMYHGYMRFDTSNWNTVNNQIW